MNSSELVKDILSYCQTYVGHVQVYLKHCSVPCLGRLAIMYVSIEQS